MGSSSKPSFLTKLLRPDKKAAPKSAKENNKRYSAPVSGWPEISQVNKNSETDLKPLEQKRKQTKKYSSQQNLSEVKKQKTTKTNPAGNKEKRQSGVFSSLFCMSGNTDTLNRSSLPVNTNNKNANTSNMKKGNNKRAQIPVDILRQNGGKKIKNNKNRHSAPVIPEWSTVRIPDEAEDTEYHATAQDVQISKPRRDSSPSVRYRFDGTLEKPYVFPAGLTFGPEGRKLNLRRSSNTQVGENPQDSPRAIEKVVKAEVQKSSTEDIIMEYSYEESEPDPNDFDVRKAFYLKYDSNLSGPAGHLNKAVPKVRNPGLPTGDTLDGQNQEKRWKPKDISGNASQRNSKRQLRAERSKNRYSLPPKNEDFVYMGSLEDVNMMNHAEQEKRMATSSFDISRKDNVAKNDNEKRDRRNRYSTPIRNTDLVYMGSFENINQLLNLDSSSGFSLPKEDVSGSDIGEKRNSSLEASTIIDTNNKKTIVASNNFVTKLSGNHSELKRTKGPNKPVDDPSMRQECKRQSLTNWALTTGLSLPNNNNNNNSYEEYKDSEHEDEEYDMFDVSTLSAGRTRSCTQENPFSRQAGRTSCNPGNKRTFVPPPAIIVPSLSPISTVTPFSANLNRLPFMPGNKPFSIPPPPSYTPPKEDVAFPLANLKDTMCHQGSQTDLSIEFANLTMVDRDSSLQLAEVKTILAAASARNGRDDVFEAPSDFPNHLTNTYESLVQRSTPDNVTSSIHLKPTKPTLHMSDSSQLSDEVFSDSQSHSFSKKETAMPSRLKTTSATNSCSDWEKIHLVNSSPDVFLPKRDIDTTKDASQKGKQINISDGAAKSASNNSLNWTTSTPKGKQSIQSNCTGDSKPNIPPNRPIPPPRTIYSPLGWNGNSDDVMSVSQKDLHQQRTNNQAPPVPKKRHSLSYSKSLSSAGDFEKSLVPAEVSLEGDSKKSTIGRLARTQSYDPSSTLQRRQNRECANVLLNNDTDNKYEDTNDEHLYEDIDSSKQENIYEVCGDLNSENCNGGGFSKNLDKGKAQIRSLEHWLTPLLKIKLERSPGQQRKNRPRGSLVRETASAHNGLAYSLDELADVFAEKRCHFYDNDDNSSIADDEMSLSNEEDMEDRLKQHSLRRCVSADNLLRAGSILDRSMILAKKRRRRMRERRSKSHIFTDSKDFMEFSAFSNFNTNCDNNANGSKVRYNKRKTTSNERLFKHKASHTDSGHDSEIVSPCTSPDARRHLGNTTSLMSYQSPFHDLDDFSAPKQGTLPKKPWEIRLRNTQYQRKSRSRENLLTLAPKI